jgi:two-component system LytT family response regulator
VAECPSAEDAAEQLKLQPPDLVFLDICMTSLAGIELLDSISKDTVPAVIFLTAHDQYTLEAFRHEALDYLLKPVDDDRFNQALDAFSIFENRRRRT